MKKLMLIIACFLLTNQDMLAGIRSEQQMKQAAFQVLNKAKARGASCDQLKERLAMSMLRIYGYDDGGFAVVTSDDRFESVIGYSASSCTDSIPCGLKWWLETVDNNMKTIEAPTYERAKTRSSSSGAGPLLTTIWGQDRPFNDNCTYTNGNRTYQFVAGCIATAMAQVMNYYKYPVCGTGSNTYDVQYSRYLTFTLSEDFSQSVYDWENMLDDYTSYAKSFVKDSKTKAVAKLVKDCGIATNMDYSTDGSGTSLKKAEEALKTYFLYDKTTQIYDREEYQDSEWMNLVYSAIDKGRPIIYSGTETNSTNSAGHAFILHGYDCTGKVLVNWGWDGRYDGYFNINLLNPDKYRYNCKQKMLIAIPGDKASIPTMQTLQLKAIGSGSIYYGSMDGMQVREGTQSFKIKEGNSAVLFILPDIGYKLKSVNVNNKDATSTVTDYKYTISNVLFSTDIVVEFEKSSDVTSGDYNKYITCHTKSIGSGSINNNVIRNVAIEIMNAGDKTVYINKLVAQDPNTNEILFIIADKELLGEFEGGSSKSLSHNIEKDVVPVYVLEYSLDNRNYIYERGKYKLLTLSSNQYGNLVYSGITVGVDDRRFSIEPGSNVTIDFIPTAGGGLTSLSLNSSDVMSSVKNNQYIIQNFNSDNVLKASFDSGNTIDGHDFVDLGLSSGKCWSTMNYGADKPEEYGKYVSYAGAFKYGGWGDNWKVPSKTEIQELIDECVWTWTEQNGVKGYLIKGPNYRTMFLPAAGEKDRFSGIFGDSASGSGNNIRYFTSDEDGFVNTWMLYGTSSEYKLKSIHIIIEEYPVRPIATIIKKNAVVGDVNCDGVLNTNDVNSVADYIMGKTPNNFDRSAADANHDGKVNAADIVTLINLMKTSK